MVVRSKNHYIHACTYMILVSSPAARIKNAKTKNALKKGRLSSVRSRRAPYTGPVIRWWLRLPGYVIRLVYGETGDNCQNEKNWGRAVMFSEISDYFRDLSYVVGMGAAR